MGGTRWPEDLAGKAVLQLYCLTIDDDLLGPRRRPVACATIRHIFKKQKTKEMHTESQALKNTQTS